MTAFYRVERDAAGACVLRDAHTCMGVTLMFSDLVNHYLIDPPRALVTLRGEQRERQTTTTTTTTAVFYRDGSVYQVVWHGGSPNLLPESIRRAEAAASSYHPELRWADEATEEQWKMWTCIDVTKK